MTGLREKLLYAALFAGVLVSDQVPKILVARSFPFGQPVPVLGQVFMIKYLHNPGTVFGLFSAYPEVVLWAKHAGVLVLLALTLYLVIFDRFNKIGLPDTISLKVSLVMISASAVANFIDRVRVGGVIDFIDIGLGQYRWYTFNPADAYLVIGAILIIFSTLRSTDNTGIPERGI